MLMRGAFWNHVVIKGPTLEMGRDWIPWWVFLWMRGLAVQVLFSKGWWTYSEFNLNTVQRIHLHHAVWPPVDQLRFHTSRSLFNGLPAVFCLSVCSVLVFSVICHEAFSLYVATSFCCNPVFCPKLGLHLIPLQSFIICPSVSCYFSHIICLCCCYSSCVSCFFFFFFFTTV
jgi:hypothetical protein